MNLFSQLGGLFQQYASGASVLEGEVHGHFDQVAQSVDPSSLATGLAEAFRSGRTPPFAQMAAHLFANSGGDQQANMINTLLETAGPAGVAPVPRKNPPAPPGGHVRCGHAPGGRAHA